MVEIRPGLDIDGTITADPEFFARLSRKVIAAGGVVHVVSSRSPETQRETLKELKGLDVSFSKLYLLPPISTAQTLCPHKNLDWYQRHQWLKVEYPMTHRITHFVDDDTKVLALFARFAPTVEAILLRF